MLSRISIPFGMLSVCTEQVTHALLTRPPLSQLRIIRRIFLTASLDLHVLGTPPAFILSQDQTLKIKFVNFISQFTIAKIKVYFLMKFPAQTNHYLNIWLGLLLVLIRVN